MTDKQIIGIMAAIIFHAAAGKDIAYQDTTLKYLNKYCIEKAKSLFNDVK